MAAEFAYAKDLLDDLDARHVSGAVIEFGVFEGMWLSHIADHVYQKAARRDIWGLDSFEGLPPTDANDLDCFFEGQFSASMPGVSVRLRVEERPAVRLVKGWFVDTLPTQEMQDVKQIAFARIDCDLYQPTVECLEYLTPRLVDGAVLVFDDWTWNLDKGETKACREWIGQGLPLHLQFLAYGVNGHIYFRVRRE